MNPQTLMFSMWLLMAFDILVYLACCVALFSHLKRKHTGVWETLGSPSLFWNNSLRNNVLFLKFLLRRDYAPLNDPTLSKIAIATAALLSLGVALFLANLVVFWITRGGTV